MSHGLDQRTLSAGIAHLDVGTPHVPFDVHIELLCDRSPYFDRLLKDRAGGSIAEQPILLPDDDPDVFAEVISWMYRREFSRKFEMPEAQNSVMSAIGERIRRKPTSIFTDEPTHYAYSRTPPESPLRSLVVDTYSRNVTKVQFLRHRQEAPRSFLEDVCYSLIQRKSNAGDDDVEPIKPIENYFLPAVSVEDETCRNTVSTPTKPIGHYSLPVVSVEDESRRNTPSSPYDVDLAKPASPAQMARRKIKHLRMRSSSPAHSSTTSIATPDSDATSTISQGMDRLNVGY